MTWKDRITVDPNVCHGSACIRGTRVLVSVILDGLAAGDPPDAIADAYRITVEDVQAALVYASELARERVFTLPGDGLNRALQVRTRAHRASPRS